MSAHEPDATRILRDLATGDQVAREQLFPLIYSELRALAEKHLNRERPNHTLQPTALVHEAYLKLIDLQQIDWQGKAQFLALASSVIRRVLIHHARGHGAKKRGGDQAQATWVDAMAFSDRPSIDLLALDEALNKLATQNERHSRIVELRYFGGLSVVETAEVLGVSERTVKGDWRVARAWLRREIEGESTS